MEVFVRNLPQQATHKVLEKWLQPTLKDLSIGSVQWFKHKNKTFATITFLNAADGERFLALHGQVRLPGRRPVTKVPLRYLSQPVYFEKSTHPPDTTVLRGLAKEDKDRKLKSHNQKASTEEEKFKPVAWAVAGFAFGTWTYVDHELGFVPETLFPSSGIAKFGQRSMILSTDSGQRIDVRYAAILEVIMQKSPGSIIISMSEPARFFESLKPNPQDEDSLNALFGRLNLGRAMNGPERSRLPYLSHDHKGVANHCLVCRIVLSPVDGREFNDRIKSLSRIPHLPQPMNHSIRNVRYQTPLRESLKEFQKLISSLNLNLPFEIGFQVQKLVQNNYLLPNSALPLIPEIVTIYERSGLEVCVGTVVKLFTQIDYPSFEVDGEMFQTENLLELLRNNETLTLKEKQLSPHYDADEPSANTSTIPNSENEVMIHRARVTPSGVFLSGPEPESNNRVLRKYSKYHTYFIRVTFGDEDGGPVRQSFKVSHDKIFETFQKILSDGIQIAGRLFQYLGFSHSSLREKTCWLMAPFVDGDDLMDDRRVIHELGNFSSIQCPAKCAARIGQAFSDTPNTIKIRSYNVIPDIKRNDRVFSDGVGTISQQVVDEIFQNLKKKPRILPTCYQIRCQGVKGMVALDSRLEGWSVNFRPSMIKYEGSTSEDLEICEVAYKPLPLFLNRQLIKILEDMGVSDHFFLETQAEEVERLRMVTENAYNASYFLKRQKVGEAMMLPGFLTDLCDRGLEFQHDGFLRDVVEVVLLSELRQLKHKTRIPVEKGWHLHGILDETGFLEEGQVFCTVVVDGKTEIVTGKELLISRSPALHPGDVQIVEAVRPPPDSPLWNLLNCICFSQKGSRDLPSQLGGGDLDGDRFCIIFDERARAKRSFTPADYPRVEALNIGRPVNKNDMIEFFIQFMKSDQLAQIAVQHRVLADVRNEGTNDEDCLLLAEMHSTAVDFSKSGIPVNMSQCPKRPKFRPDFEAPGPQAVIKGLDGASLIEEMNIDPQDQEDEDDDMPRYRYYESTKILGKLYRAIDEQGLYTQIRKREADITSHSTVIDELWAQVKVDCALMEWKHLKDWALDIREMYETNLYSCMINYSDHPLRPLSELEAFVGNVLGKTGAQNRTQHDKSRKMKEQVEENNRYIINCILKNGDEYCDEALERSLACLAVSLDENCHKKKKDSLLSFKYLAASVCLRQVQRFVSGN